MKTKFMCLAVMALVLGFNGPAANAQIQGETVHLSFMGGGIFPNSGSEIDNGALYGLGIGYNFTENWGIEAFGHLAPNLDDDFDNHGSDPQGDNDVTLARLNALYHFNTGTKFTPYVTLGVGGQWVSRDYYDNYNSFALNGGVGFKYFFNELVALRVEANDSYGFKKPNDNQEGNRKHFNAPTITAGLTFQLGANSSCPDSDNDGVCDPYDKCPGTPAGYKVNSDGCPETVSINLEIKFDFDKAVVKPQYREEVQKVADFMAKHPETDTVVEGHTDSYGSDDYNLKLSQRRADAVRQVLVSTFGISPSRVQATGYGESRPVADNATASGRAQNRRVVGVISGASAD